MNTFDEVFAGTVTLVLKKETALVLFEMLYEVKQDSDVVPIRDDAERRAIWDIAALFESTLVEPFMHNYKAIAAEAKKRLVA
jgi:hypothetical protein